MLVGWSEVDTRVVGRKSGSVTGYNVLSLLTPTASPVCSGGIRMVAALDAVWSTGECRPDNRVGRGGDHEGLCYYGEIRSKGISMICLTKT